MRTRMSHIYSNIDLMSTWSHVVENQNSLKDLKQGPNSFNFMQFLGKFRKIVCWCPHLTEIPDPPLNMVT